MESLSEETRSIGAPLSAVWREISTLPQLLALSPEVAGFTETATDRAVWHGKMTWGPVTFRFSGVGTVEETIPERYLKWSHVFSHPRGMCLEGVFALSETASEATRLTYRAMFHHEGRVTSRFLELLGVTVDEHVRSVVERIKGLAEQHWQAEVRLGRQQVGNE